MKLKFGFTLLELIVVIIIIGILATLGFIQYTSVIEKGRKAEARANLGTLRTLEKAYYEDTASVGGTGSYSDLTNLASGLPPTGSCQATHYFSYGCDTNGACTATRCTASGKPPQAVTAYTITLDINGGFTGGGQWQ